MIRQYAFTVCVVASALSLCLAVSVLLSRSRDGRLLRSLATELTRGTTGSDERVRALNAFVYQNQGFARNERYYLLKSLRATPVQVLKAGGDCADKSRLLAAMLAQLNIRSSLAMLYECAGCAAIHTVVLARTESGTIAADPVYDLMFPSGPRGYHDVRTLISDPEVLAGRVRELRAERGPASEVSAYDESEFRYEFITTINWAKYRWLRALAGALEALGTEPRLIRRPAVLEDPKLFVASVSGLGAAAFAILAVLARRSSV